ncbi:MAG: DUF3048 domain-containing protein, partial [Acetatifactor sp.]|nr:DUF3048 domain-containing protein [Acetatifactor sp.]
MSLFAVGCGNEGNDDTASSPVELEAQSVASAATPAPAPEATTTPEPEPEGQVITERVVKDGMIQSYLTGEWVDEAIGNRRPIGVSIP